MPTGQGAAKLNPSHKALAAKKPAKAEDASIKDTDCKDRADQPTPSTLPKIELH